MRAVTVLEYRLIRNMTAQQQIALKGQQVPITPYDSCTTVKLCTFPEGGQMQDASHRQDGDLGSA